MGEGVETSAASFTIPFHAAESLHLTVHLEQSMNDPRFPGLYFIWFFVLVGGFSIVLFIISLMSGWLRLAKNYPVHKESCDRHFPGQSARVGNARCTLDVHSSPNGFYLSASLLFFDIGLPSPFPPVFIPWEAIRNAKTKRILGLGPEVVEFDIGLPIITTLRLPRRVFEGHESVIDGVQTIE